ncbi:MAG: hypothetical protein ABEJ56_05820 [Candidatus Nanohaloarchaea archaeon]
MTNNTGQNDHQENKENQPKEKFVATCINNNCSFRPRKDSREKAEEAARKHEHYARVENCENRYIVENVIRREITASTRQEAKKKSRKGQIEVAHSKVKVVRTEVIDDVENNEFINYDGHGCIIDQEELSDHTILESPLHTEDTLPEGESELPTGKSEMRSKKNR